MRNGSKLDKLSLKGFKSFSKQTSLMFAPGITAIVGPNGSGKSNIIDAISFVMGSLSFSSLRAKSAENLLHFGKTKKSTEAEIELAIKTENSLAEDGFIKLHRKLLKDGTSVYRINGKRSTRLATLDTLASIFIFPDSHNIVHQGEITKFINMTPRERRELIEVVAGIELYEAKKRKAMTDLEDVEGKAEKVEAVHGERMRIFNRLKTEKERVQKFQDLKKLEGRARFGLLLQKIEKLHKEAKRLLTEKDVKKQEIEEINQRIRDRVDALTDVNTNLEKKGMREKVDALTQLQGLKLDVGKLEDYEDQEKKNIERSETRLNSIKSQIEGLKRRKETILGEIRANKERSAEIQEEIAKYRKLKGDLASRLSKAKQDFERKKKQYEKLKTRKEELALKSKEVALEKDSTDRIRKELENRLNDEQARKLELEAARKKAMNQRRLLEKEGQEIGKKLEKLSEKIEILRDKERAILYSSSLPAGVRALKEKGYKVLGEVVKDPSAIMPFALSVVAPEGKEPTLDKGWAFTVPENFDLEKLKELSKLGKPLGAISAYEFKGEGEREGKLQELEAGISELDKQADAMRARKATIEGRLGQKLDPHEIKRVTDEIKSLKSEIAARKKEAGGLGAELKGLEAKIDEIGELKEPELSEQSQLEEYASKLLKLEAETMRLSSESKAGENTLKNLVEPDILNYQKLQKELGEEITAKRGDLKGLDEKRAGLLKGIKKFEAAIEEIEGRLQEELGKKTELEDIIKESQNGLYQLKADITIIDERVKDIRSQATGLEKTKPPGIEPVENPAAVLREVTEELERLGTLNFRAGEEFEEISKLVEDISERLDKLREERDAILKMMDEIEAQKREMFMETFNRINENFSRIFSEVIEGASRLEMDAEDPFESGIHIKTNVRGRELPTESLSGGQKTLAAIALIFAIQEVKPSPFYIFDEVDAALDKDNSEKLAVMLKKMSETTQIVTITHNDIVVRESDQIVGVYMKSGSSRLLSLPKEKVMQEADSWIGKRDENGQDLRV